MDATKQITANDPVAEPFQPSPTSEKWTAQDMHDNRHGTVVRTGLYLKDKKKSSALISDLSIDLTKEVKTREAADVDLDKRLTAVEHGGAQSDAWKVPLATEIAERKDADRLLREDLNDEISTRTSIDASLANQISQETKDRAAADGLNASAISSLQSSLGTAAYKDFGNSAGKVPVVGANGQLDPSIVPNISSGGSTVTSVNTKTGAVVLRGSDITVSTTNSDGIDTALDKKFNKADVLPIASGGTNNAYGISQGVKANELTVNSLANGGTIVNATKLEGNYQKLFGNVAAGTAGSPQTGSVLHGIFTSNGTTSMSVALFDEGTGKTYTSIITGTYSDKTFTISAAPTWHKIYGDSDIIPSANGGTGRTDGKVSQLAIAVAPSSIDTLFTTGVYQINGFPPTGYPNGEHQSYAMLEVQNSDNNDTANSFAFQKLTVVGGHVWLRQRSGNPVVWGSWARIDETSDVIDNNTDLNTITSSGRYHAGGTTGLTNNPAGVNGWFTLVVDALNANNGSQTIFDTNTGKMYTRVWNIASGSFTFTPWKEMLGNQNAVPTAPSFHGLTVDPVVTHGDVQWSLTDNFLCLRFNDVIMSVPDRNQKTIGTISGVTPFYNYSTTVPVAIDADGSTALVTVFVATTGAIAIQPITAGLETKPFRINSIEYVYAKATP